MILENREKANVKQNKKNMIYLDNVNTEEYIIWICEKPLNAVCSLAKAGIVIHKS